MRVHVLALNGVFDTGLATVLDSFQTANELAASSNVSSRFEVTIVSVRKSDRSAQGLTVPVRAIGNSVPDVVVVPAIGFKMPDPLQRALDTAEIRNATEVLQHWAQEGATMSAACIGTFVMAAGAAVPPTLSGRAPRRIEHDRQIGEARHGRSGLESHGSGALADQTTQSETRSADREISHRGFEAVPVRLHPVRSSGARGSGRRTIRALGSGAAGR